MTRNEEIINAANEYVAKIHSPSINGFQASMNILLEGERIVGARSAEYTLMENPTVDDRGNAS